MSKLTVAQVQEQVNVQKFSTAFNEVWHPYMLNGGRADTVSRRRYKREQIYDALRSTFPVESKCLDKYRKIMSKTSKERGGLLGLNSADLKQLAIEDPQAYVGHELMRRISSAPAAPKKEKIAVPLTANGKKIGRPSKDDIEVAKARYESCARLFNWVPFDGAAASLLGCSIGSITAIRNGMIEANHIFTGNGDNGYIVEIRLPEPTPEPLTLMERILEALTKLPKDELQTIEELLDTRVA
jgi:hypothetical protein